MAQYGTSPSFTGWSPTLGSNAGAGGSPAASGTSGSVYFNGLSQDDARVAHFLQNKANQAVRMLMITLTGATVGATASKAFKRVQAQNAFDPVTGAPNPNAGNVLNGGQIPVESVSYINRVTTTGDQGNILALLNRLHGPAAYAIDVSGNGGGGKAQFGTQFSYR